MQTRDEFCIVVLHSAQYGLLGAVLVGQDLWYLSSALFGCISLLLNKLPSAVRVTCRGWDCSCGYVSSLNPLRCLPNGQRSAGESFCTNTCVNQNLKDHAGIFFFLIQFTISHSLWGVYIFLSLCYTIHTIICTFVIMFSLLCYSMLL